MRSAETGSAVHILAAGGLRCPVFVIELVEKLASGEAGSVSWLVLTVEKTGPCSCTAANISGSFTEAQACAGR